MVNLSSAAMIHMLVAACDAHVSHSNASSSITSSPPETPRSVGSGGETFVATLDPLDSSKRSPPPRAVNASRDRMKQEMHHLRDTVEELQRQLDEIKRDHLRRSPRPLTPLTPTTAQLVAAWESLARGQCEQRYRAEVENAKLRKLLDEQVKIAHTLERMLTKRRTSEQWLNDERATKRTRMAMPRSMDNPAVLAQMDALLPSLYAQIDAVLAKDCFVNDVAVFRSVDVRHADNAGAFVEATERRIVPFAYADVSDAMWASFASSPMPSFSETHEAYGSIVREFELHLQLPRFTGPIRFTFIAKRFVETHRVVVVWIAMVDPSTVSDAPLDGVQIRHTGWMCVRDAPIAYEKDAPAMAECLMAQVSVPEFEGVTTNGDCKKQRRGCALTTFVVHSIHVQLDASKQSLDNMLLERSLARTTARGV